MMSGVTAVPKLMKLAAVLVVVSVTLYQTYDSGYDNGYNAKTNEYQEAYNTALRKKTEEYTKAVVKARRIAESDAEARWKRQGTKREIKVVTEKVIEYVDREIKVPVGCSNLAKSINRLLIDSTDSITRITEAEDTNRPRTIKSVPEFEF